MKDEKSKIQNLKPAHRPPLIRTRLVVVIGLLGLLLTLGARPVSAHANLVRSDPADGAVLDEAPRQLRLWFKDTIVQDLTKIELFDGDGRGLPIVAVRPAASGSDNERLVVLVIELPELSPNAYRLSWQTRSEDDLHLIAGSVIFGVQRAVSSSNSSQSSPAPQPVEVILRWFGFVGMSGLTGTLALLFLVIPVGQIQPVGRKLLKLASFSALLAFIAGVGLLLEQGWAEANWWLILSRTGYGLRWLLSEGLLVVLAVLLFKASLTTLPPLPSKEGGNKWLAASERPGLFLQVLTLALLITQALNGHSDGTKGLWWVNLPINILHLLAASLWVGGLLGLVVTVGPLLRKGGEELTLAWMVLRRFSGLAALSVVVLVATGLYKSGQQVASLDALLETLYGQALLIKIELVLLAGLVGLFNTALLRPNPGKFLARILRRKSFSPRLFWRALMIEAGLAVGVLLLAGFLTTGQPARGPEYDPPTGENNFPASLTTQANDLVVTFSIKPNRPGQNFLNLSIFNTRRPAPALIKEVLVRLQSPGARQEEVILPAPLLEPNRYQISGNNLKVAGDWKIGLIIRREGLPDTTLNLPWTVLPFTNAERRPVLVSNQPLEPGLTLAAIIVALLAVAVIIWLKAGKSLKTKAVGLKLSWTNWQGQPQRREEK